jgi:hypothetical protein
MVCVTGYSQVRALAGGKTVHEGLEVTCDCPDGERQREESLQTGTTIVCKHGHVALMSVLDIELERTGAKRVPETTANRFAGFATVDLALAGELTRLKHGLASSTAEEVLAMIRTRLGTVKGLRAAAQLFTPSLMPTKIVRYCQRCEKEWAGIRIFPRSCDAA